MILSEFIWSNSNIRIDSNPVHFYFSSDKNLNFISQLFNDNGNIKACKDFKIEFRLKDTYKIYWLQIIYALPETWKDKGNAKNLVIFDLYLVRKSQICSLSKRTSKVLYLILVDANTAKPTMQDYFDNLFETSPFNWKNFFFLIRNTTLDTKASVFRYNVLHNILYANKILFKFGKVTSPRCSFCTLHDETIMDLFHDWLIVKIIWKQLKSLLSNNFILPISTS